jgi:hypothetical protein
MPLYSIRSIFHHPTRSESDELYLYEERVTLWNAESLSVAYKLAEDEAVRYASEAKAVFVRTSDGFSLFDDKFASGIEVWSKMRGSNFSPEDYIETFIWTRKDRGFDFPPMDQP